MALSMPNSPTVMTPESRWKALSSVPWRRAVHLSAVEAEAEVGVAQYAFGPGQLTGDSPVTRLRKPHRTLGLPQVGGRDIGEVGCHVGGVDSVDDVLDRRRAEVPAVEVLPLQRAFVQPRVRFEDLGRLVVVATGLTGVAAAGRMALGAGALQPHTDDMAAGVA